MTTKKKKTHTRKKQRKRELRFKIVFWICFLLLLIPCVAFGWILLSSWLDTGSPILGSRYDGDLDPAITKNDMEDVLEKVQKISDVEGVEVHLATATLRVYADITDSASAVKAESIASEVYAAVYSVLKPETYFSQHDGMKMYDLEIHVYTTNNSEKSNFVYVIETKTSSMEEPITQLVSEPIDADLAQQLRDSVENRGKEVETDDSNEIVVSGGEGEIIETEEPEEDEETEETEEEDY